mmetsp:Transcript_2848/g.11431  ORF Transcript_2848/g.11431 Transcript_2848/m.11431 type:complete len:425 (+) Transcript_2848:1593-2867(+)
MISSAALPTTCTPSTRPSATRYTSFKKPSIGCVMLGVVSLKCTISEPTSASPCSSTARAADIPTNAIVGSVHIMTGGARTMCRGHLGCASSNSDSSALRNARCAWASPVDEIPTGSMGAFAAKSPMAYTAVVDTPPLAPSSTSRLRMPQHIEESTSILPSPFACRPTESNPSCSLVPTRPTQERSASHFSSSPLVSRTLPRESPPDRFGGMAATMSCARRTSMPRLSIRRLIATTTSSSTCCSTNSSSSRQTRVTRAPSPLMMAAYSVPIIPPPWTTRSSGTKPRLLAGLATESESKSHPRASALSHGSTLGRAACEPVARKTNGARTVQGTAPPHGVRPEPVPAYSKRTSPLPPSAKRARVATTHTEPRERGDAICNDSGPGSDGEGAEWGAAATSILFGLAPAKPRLSVRSTARAIAALTSA